MKLQKFLFATFLSIAFISCGNDDDNPPVAELTVSTDGISTTYRTQFYAAGETDVVVVMKGETPVTIGNEAGEATITLDPSADPAVTYKPLTNVVEWTNLLPLGEHEVTIIAEVDGEQATKSITIQNRFEGVFNGGANIDPMNIDPNQDFGGNLTLTFEDDGTGSAGSLEMLFEFEGLHSGEGTWTRDGHIISTSAIAFGEEFGFFQGTLTHNAEEAFIDGFWYNGVTESIDDAIPQGYFKIDLIEEIILS